MNVLAVEAHPTAIPYSVWKRYDEFYTWPTIGVLKARLTVSPADAAITNGLRLRGLQVWNCAVNDTVTAGNDLREVSAPVRPVVIRAARNSVFSGRLMVGSDQTIKGLTVSVSDLVRLRKSSSSSAKRSSSSNARVENEDDDEDEGGGAKLPASAVRVRYAVPATPGKSWAPQGRFDGLLDQIPAEIPTNVVTIARTVNWPHPVTNALAPLWFTVRVPGNARAGLYEGRITIAAQGFQPQTVPIQVRVYDWALPDPPEWRVQNFIYHAEEVAAQHYEVPNYSDRHFELVGKSLALLAELNSRQVQVNLVCDFFANGYSGSMSSNPESLVRWIKQPDGSFKHDFTNFDRYLEMVARTIGKPRTLRLNCWGDCNPGRVGTPWISEGFDNSGERPVTVLDPATGKLTRMKQPPLGTEENYRFWKPVFDEMLKKIKARGWLDETTLGYNAWFALSLPKLVDEANRLWPGGEWSFTGHNGAQDMLFRCIACGFWSRTTAPTTDMDMMARAMASTKPVAPTAANVKGSDSRTPALTRAKQVPIKIKNTGGTVSESTDAAGVRWTVLIFTNNGTLEVAKDGIVDVLVVGGGGGGGGGVGGTWDDAGNATKPKGGGGYNGSKNGMANTGGGGAGGRKGQPVGGNGGSGIVIVRFIGTGL